MLEWVWGDAREVKRGFRVVGGSSSHNLVTFARLTERVQGSGVRARRFVIAYHRFVYVIVWENKDGYICLETYCGTC